MGIVTRPFAACSSPRACCVARVHLFLVSPFLVAQMSHSSDRTRTRGEQATNLLLTMSPPIVVYPTFVLSLPPNTALCTYISFTKYWIQTHIVFSDWSLARKIGRLHSFKVRSMNTTATYIPPPPPPPSYIIPTLLKFIFPKKYMFIFSLFTTQCPSTVLLKYVDYRFQNCGPQASTIGKVLWGGLTKNLITTINKFW
jgi:hypothetical protein